MHICLPDTREVRPSSGSAFLLYNVHIDGLYHCSLRYKQLLHLHQTLSKAFASSTGIQLPAFPPKKLLPLSLSQVEERRLQLEKYLQNISQDKAICNSPIFNLFLLEAQRESTRIREGQVHLDIELVNGQKIRLQIVTHDSADAILTAVCRALGLKDIYHSYFCLCLCGYDVVRDKLIIKRRFSFFESPYITLQMAIQQQEQIHNVLTATNTYNTNGVSCSGASSGSSSSSNNSNNNNISSNNNQSTNGNNLFTSTPTSCRYCSCTNYIQANSIATGVPHLGSSGGSIQNVNLQHQHTTNNSTNERRLASTYVQRTSLNSSSSTAKNFVTHRILLRKSYWDPMYDTYILGDQQALNLLFIQTVYDMKHSLMFVDRKTYHQLESYLASDSKLEYILLARTLKYYNYVHFEPCLSDYPRPKTKVMISIGSKELNMRVLKSPLLISTSALSTTALRTSSTSERNNNNLSPNDPNEDILYCTSTLVPSGYQHLITKNNLVEEEYNFKVPLIRCWRLTSLETLNSNSPDTSCSSATSSFRRKSLSLFGGVLGSSNANNTNINDGASNSNRINSTDLYNCNNNSSDGAHRHRSLISSGFGGNSLLVALSASNQDRQNSHNDQFSDSANLDKRQSNHLRTQECSSCHLVQRIDHNLFSQYELSFEYLISKDTLRWITISSDQAIFISISLQGVVDELVSKRKMIEQRSSLIMMAPQASASSSTTAGTTTTTTATTAASAAAHRSNGLTQPISIGRPSRQMSQSLRTEPTQLTALPLLVSPTNYAQTQSFSYMYRDGSQRSLSIGNQQLLEKFTLKLAYSQSMVSNNCQQLQPLTSPPPDSSSLLSIVNNTNRNNDSINGSYSSLAGSSGSSLNYSRLTTSNLIGRPQHTAIFEISNFKKAPSPIINDAFEGVANDDDL